MLEEWKQVIQIIYGQCGEGLVSRVHFQKPISLFANTLSIIAWTEGLPADNV
jgi:hypothetical protein